MKGKYIITSDSWFIGPDGEEYRAVWGEVQVLEDSFLGVRTNRNSTNWFLRVGTDDDHVIIAGCQVHHAAKVDVPKIKKYINGWTFHDGAVNESRMPTKTYFTGQKKKN